jgi:hypothetical protein
MLNRTVSCRVGLRPGQTVLGWVGLCQAGSCRAESGPGQLCSFQLKIGKFVNQPQLFIQCWLWRDHKHCTSYLQRIYDLDWWRRNGGNLGQNWSDSRRWKWPRTLSQYTVNPILVCQSQIWPVAEKRIKYNIKNTIPEKSSFTFFFSYYICFFIKCCCAKIIKRFLQNMAKTDIFTQGGTV